LYSSIRIQGYRGLDSFRMQGLGRVNLLVGTNNCGKTSILECIELLRSAGDPTVLSAITDRRGEWVYATDGDSGPSTGPRPVALDVSHFLANHALGSRRICIEADRSGDVDAAKWNDQVTVYLEGPTGRDYDEWGAEVPEGAEDERLVLHVKWSDAEDHYKAVLTDDGCLSASQVRRPSRLARAARLTRTRNGSSQAVQFVRTGGMTATDVVRTFSKFVLTPTEESITQALRSVEPTVERIAPVVDEPVRVAPYSPGGMVVKLHDGPGRVPIGSMGDGMWRMLGLALALANADGGVLLVDEIDTGLHYSVMEDMWRMISRQAAALSVQVFATTHSRDCYESLAAIAESDADGVTIQRIDRSRGEAVGFSREAVVAAAERNIEVR